MGRRKTWRSRYVINRGIKVVVEKLDCFGAEGKERAGGQDGKGKKDGINGEDKVVVEKLVTIFSMMMVLEWQAVGWCVRR